ncbi:MAG: iron-containing alcohol dehydrogenase, partial [Spirochaetaceae bacterium]
MQFFESYLERLGPAISPPPEIILGAGGVETVARRFAALPAGTRVWIISDENTDAAFPLRSALSSFTSAATPVSDARIAACPALPGTPRVVPDDFLVEKITRDVVAAKVGLVVAIGGGTISDIAKRVSYLAGVPNWCIGTAPSVDAYTSAKSAIRVDGYHNGIPATPSSLVVCDVDVMAAAPQILFLSGVGDLTAKYFAYLEWYIASLVTGEPYSEREASFALDSARRAVAAFQSLPSGARADA